LGAGKIGRIVRELVARVSEQDVASGIG